MMRLISTLFALALFALATLPFNPYPNLWVWKLSVISTEYGHWLAPVAAVYALVSLFDSSKFWRRLRFPLFAISALLLAAPALILHFTLQSAESDFIQVFGAAAPVKEDAKRLYSINALPVPFERKPPETMSYGDLPSQKLDYYPAPETVSLTGGPWVLVIHGGGWDSGDQKQLPNFNYWLQSQGYAVFAMTYRLAPKDHWPAPREDVRTAVGFIQARAADYKIDAQNWVIFGRSAGGHIAESYAFGAHDRSLRGLIALYAPADLKFAYDSGRHDDVLHSLSLLRSFMGGSPAEFPRAYVDASPIQDVTPQSPPTLLLHGERDTLVWHKQSERLSAKLNENKVPSVFVSLPWGVHGFEFNLNGPGGQVTTYAIEQFLGKVLRR